MRYFGPRTDAWTYKYAPRQVAYFMWDPDQNTGYWISDDGTVLQRSWMSSLTEARANFGLPEVDNPALPSYMAVDEGL